MTQRSIKPGKKSLVVSETPEEFGRRATAGLATLPHADLLTFAVNVLLDNRELSELNSRIIATYDALLEETKKYSDEVLNGSEAVRRVASELDMPFTNTQLDLMRIILKNFAEELLKRSAPTIAAHTAKMKNIEPRLWVIEEWRLAKIQGAETKGNFASRMSDQLKNDSRYFNEKTGRHGITISAKQISEVWLKGE